MNHVPGTIYPLGGQPHTPYQCSHRTSPRGYQPRTILCYEPGVYEIQRPDGTYIELQSAEGLVPFRRCEKHAKGWAESYAPTPDGQRVKLVVCRRTHLEEGANALQSAAGGVGGLCARRTRQPSHHHITKRR